MKKLLALLLALSLVAGAFAQVTTSLAASGTVVLYDQDGMAKFAPDGNGYDTLTFKGTDKDGKFGFSVTDQNWISDGAFTIRDWNVWFKGQYTKVIAGQLRNGDFRGTLPTGLAANYLFGMDRISGYGLLIESVTLGDLTLGVNLPIGTTAMEFADVLQKTDIGVKYNIADVGTFYALANLDLVAESNVIGAAFKYTGMENLVASVVFKGTFAAANTLAFAAGASYTMDKIGIMVEFDGQNTTEFSGEIALRGTYAVTEKMSGQVDVLYDFAGTYDVGAKLSYDYLTGLGSYVKAGYNGEVYYEIGATYSVAF